MAKKKKPQAGKKKPAPPNKKSAQPVRGEKNAPAKKQDPKPARVKKAAPVKKVKPKRVTGEKQAPSATKAPLGGREILRRAAVAAAVLLTVCGIVLSSVSLYNDLLEKKVPLYYAGMLQRENVMPIEMQDEQVRKSVRATKRHGKTHAFDYFCSRTIQLDPDSLSGYILFGNPAGNDCDLILSIFDSEDNLLFRSGGLTPGNYLTQIRLAVDGWENGEYACKAVVTAYRGQNIDYKCIGAQYSRLTVKVGETS